MSEPLHWFQRLHWRGAFAFLVILIVIEAPIWWLVGSGEIFEPERAVARALGLATLGAVLAAVIHTVAASFYMDRRMNAARRMMLGSVADDGRNAVAPDEVTVLAEEIGGHVEGMRTSLMRLQLEGGRLRTLLEGMGDAVLMFDDSERVLVANAVAEKLLNLPRNYAKQRVSDVCDIPQLHALVAEILWAHEPSTIDLDLEGKHEMRHLTVTGTPIVGKDDVNGGILVIHDLTQLRRLERVRRDFVANVSHELRTPIASVRSAAETLLMADTGLEPRLLQFLEAIERNAERMGTLVEDLLVLSRLEAAGEALELHEVRLSEVFARIIDVCEPMARDQGVEFVVDIADDLPTVYAESSALQQIIQNLVENGIKYTPAGGHVTLSARPKGKRRVRVKIVDDGPGIAPEHLPRIFERFYRVDMGRSRDIGGTGLGLSIVKHLVRKLKAKIDVESERERGTTFKLTLQVYRPEEQK